MLHDAQRICAPSACSVSISTAVWMVMCSEPVMRAPLSGCDLACLRRIAIRPGISCSAMRIALRPQSASEGSAITLSVEEDDERRAEAVAMGRLLLSVHHDRAME